MSVKVSTPVGDTPPVPHHLAQGIRLGVYLALLVSAGCAFWLGDRLWAAARMGTLPIWVALVPVSAFSLFVLIYAVDRWLLVKRRRYPLGRALFQVALAVFFGSLLWPHQALEIQAARSQGRDTPRMSRLLRHADADVRAAACELVGLLKEAGWQPRLTEMIAKDKSQEVRRTCAEALQRLEVEPPTP